jgi:hypothetical protein
VSGVVAPVIAAPVVAKVVPVVEPGLTGFIVDIVFGAVPAAFFIFWSLAHILPGRMPDISDTSFKQAILFVSLVAIFFQIVGIYASSSLIFSIVKKGKVESRFRTPVLVGLILFAIPSVIGGIYITLIMPIILYGGASTYPYVMAYFIAMPALICVVIKHIRLLFALRRL